jgi:hypothetical protein
MAQLEESLPCSVPATRYKHDDMGASRVWGMGVFKNCSMWLRGVKKDVSDSNGEDGSLLPS